MRIAGFSRPWEGQPSEEWRINRDLLPSAVGVWCGGRFIVGVNQTLQIAVSGNGNPAQQASGEASYYFWPNTSQANTVQTLQSQRTLATGNDFTYIARYRSDDDAFRLRISHADFAGLEVRGQDARVYYTDTGPVDRTVTVTTSPTQFELMYTAVGRKRGADLSCFTKFGSASSTLGDGTIYNNSSPTVLKLGTNGNGRGPLSLAVWCSAAESDAAVQEILQNPREIFERRRIWVPVSAGGSAATIVGRSLHVGQAVNRANTF